MKKFLAFLFLLFASLVFSEAYAQEPHCYSKKIKIKKVSKRRKGNLVGIKGIDDRKALKKQMKERTKQLKVKEQEAKKAEKAEKKSKNDNLENEPVDEETPIDDK